MKKILPVLLLITILFSCKKNQGPQPATTNPNATLLVGKWVYTQDTVKVYENGVVTGIFTDGGGVKFDGTFFEQFDKNGGGLTQGPTDFASKYTYTIDGNIITAIHQKQVIQGYTTAAVTKTYTIKFISSSKMVLYNENFTPPGATDKITEISYFIKE
ncbi:hypothetical protein [Mucilaginibacter sp.]|jgi:hypothetical protein|uniref:hypothetical protein n=1 Tax=Mucilaginibacter sp. TaxID=1882438 RepID=UPI0025F8E6A9|nr:hypothetical protein [Mucilaginibacter sp.]